MLDLRCHKVWRWHPCGQSQPENGVVQQVLRQMKKEGRPERLWNFTYPEYCKMFSLCLQDLAAA